MVLRCVIRTTHGRASQLRSVAPTCHSRRQCTTCNHTDPSTLLIRRPRCAVTTVCSTRLANARCQPTALSKRNGPSSHGAVPLRPHQRFFVGRRRSSGKQQCCVDAHRRRCVGTRPQLRCSLRGNPAWRALNIETASRVLLASWCGRVRNRTCHRCRAWQLRVKT